MLFRSKEIPNTNLRKIITSILIKLIEENEDFGTNTILNSKELKGYKEKDCLNMISLILEHFTKKGNIKRVYRGQYKVIKRIKVIKTKLDVDDIDDIKNIMQDYIERVASKEYTIKSRDIEYHILTFLYHHEIDIHNIVVNTPKVIDRKSVV